MNGNIRYEDYNCQMKVLRVISSMDPSGGGVAQGVRNTIPEMTKLGVQTEVACLDAPDAPFIGHDHFKVIALGPAKTSWRHSPQLIPWLCDNLRNYDVVVVEGLWQYHGYAVRKAIRHLRQTNEKNIPGLYVMPHGMLDPYFQRASGRKLKAIRNWLYWKLIESKVINGADGIFFTCEEELRLARQTFTPYHPKRELNVGLGIENPPAFTASMSMAFTNKCPAVSGKPYILFLSRIHEKKGVDLLVNAYEKIIGKNAGAPLLVIAGPGMDTPYGESIRLCVEKSGALRDRVFFTGMISGDEKWGAFYGSEAFILPSHQENFGIAVAEALACSKPVMISDQVNIWREIKDSGAGFVSPDTEEGVLGLLSAWLGLSPDMKIKMGEKGLETYRKYFAIEPAAKRVYEIMNNN
jgi:glycosyltransferase involved in cell wall biosynthesis